MKKDYDHSITEANKKLMENVMGFLFQGEPLKNVTTTIHLK